MVFSITRGLLPVGTEHSTAFKGPLRDPCSCCSAYGRRSCQLLHCKPAPSAVPGVADRQFSPCSGHLSRHAFHDLKSTQWPQATPPHLRPRPRWGKDYIQQEYIILSSGRLVPSLDRRVTTSPAFIVRLQMALICSTHRFTCSVLITCSGLSGASLFGCLRQPEKRVRKKGWVS